MYKTRITPLLLAAVLTFADLLWSSKSAHSQVEDRTFDRRVTHGGLVFTDNDVYFVGQPTQLYDGTTIVYPDPRGRYALIDCIDAKPTRAAFFAPQADPEETTSRNASLLLYDSQTGKTTTLWHHTLLPGQTGGVSSVVWLAGRDVALASVGSESLDAAPTDPARSSRSDFSLLEIHPNAETPRATRTLFHGANPILPFPSPKLPVALLLESGVEYDAASERPTRISRYRSLSATGGVGQPLPLSARASGGYEWSDGGDIAYLVDTLSIVGDATNDPQNSPTPATRPTRQWYALSVESGKLIPLDKKPASTTRPDRARGADSPLPLRLVGEAALISPPSLTTEPAKAQAAGQTRATSPASIAAPTVARRVEKLWPLWLQRRDAPNSGEHYPTAALIAGDAGAATLLPDGSAILYVSDGILKAVPLVRQPRADVEGPYRKYLQQKTLSNAKQIGLALLQYSQDYDEKLPSVTDVVKTLSPYMRDSSITNNPETGQLGFVYLMDGESMATIDSPATKVMGYLSGPGGRAALYADGHAKWQPDAGSGS